MADSLTIRDELERAYSAVISSREGVIVLKHIMEVTGFNHELKTYNPATSELNIHATLYNLSKRDVWIRVKDFLTPKQQSFLEEESFIKVELENTDNSEDEDNE